MGLQALVFLCGTVTMILEIVAARFFAPYVGTSLPVWTGVIGVILAGLGCGYSLGGAWGDRWKSEGKLRFIIAGAGGWIAVMALLREPLIGALASHMRDVAGVAVAGSMLLLFVPSLLLGAVTPYAVRLSTRDVAHAGRTAGNLGSLSTVGAIIGTFAAGLVLIPAFGTTAILFGCAAVLGGAALAGRSAKRLGACVLFLAAVAALALLQHGVHARMLERHGIVREQDSAYSVIRVERRATGDGGEAAYLDIDHGQHAAYEDAAPERHVLAYTAYYRLADAFRPDIRSALLLGGGGYTVARDFLARHPGGTADVAELDPAVTALAREYFGLRDDTRLRIDHEDARVVLNRGGGLYQAVYGDAFRSELSVPFHLATREAALRVSAVLDGSGVYVLNVIASPEGRRSRILKAEVATLRSVFPEVTVFQVPNGGTADPLQFENFTIVAAKQPLLARALANGDAEMRAMLAQRFDVRTGAADTILTDDYAPVEAMVNL